MAPKKKEKNLKRSNIITLKLTDIELAVLNEAADVTGLSRSEYLRKFLLEKQINHQIEVVADMNDLRKLVSEYGKIGSNLNQIAKHFNSGGSQSRAIENEIHQCITDLSPPDIFPRLCIYFIRLQWQVLLRPFSSNFRMCCL